MIRNTIYFDTPPPATQNIFGILASGFSELGDFEFNGTLDIWSNTIQISGQENEFSTGIALADLAVPENTPAKDSRVLVSLNKIIGAAEISAILVDGVPNIIERGNEIIN